MNDFIHLTGVVATQPRHIVTNEGLAITSFRLASTHRRYQRSSNSWVDGDTNWYTVTAFRQLARNTQQSIRRGDRLILSGRLRLKSWENGEKTGMNVEVDADVIGHDLNWGTDQFTRVSHSSAQAVQEVAGEQPAQQELTAATGDARAAQPGGQHHDASEERASIESAPAPAAVAVPVPF